MYLFFLCLYPHLSTSTSYGHEIGKQSYIKYAFLPYSANTQRAL